MSTETKTGCEPQHALSALIEFANDGMCGRCLPCPLATKQAIIILGRIIDGRGEASDLARLLRVADRLVDASRCPKGEETARTLGESLKNAAEFDMHIEGICPKGTCLSLTRFRVVPEHCTMCGKCKEVCPETAIEGDLYVPYLGDNRPYVIREAKCNGCGECVKVCPEGAIERVT